MRFITQIIFVFLVILGSNLPARSQNNTQQPSVYYEQFGNTLNLGVGMGYFSYIGYAVTAFHADYELNVSRNFTLAPFIDIFTISDQIYWGNNQNSYRYYHYREMAFPIGIKGTYYLDRFLNLNRNWDLYLGASLGVTIRTFSWQDGDNAQSSINEGSGPLFLELHAGGEYHATRRLGIFVDLSTRISTIGLSIHRGY